MSASVTSPTTDPTDPLAGECASCGAVIGERCWHRLTLYEQHQVLADIIEEDCIAACGTEYNAWPLPDLQAYAEHLMLGLEAMTPDEVHRRFRAEPDPRGEHEASRAYWIAIVTGEGSADSVEA